MMPAREPLHLKRWHLHVPRAIRLVFAAVVLAADAVVGAP